MTTITESAIRQRQELRRVGWVALIAAALTVGLITFGDFVRASGSGLGCPDWPLCHSEVVPALQGHTVVEWGHRLFASVVVIFTVAGTLLAYRERKFDPTLAKIMYASLGIILFQAVLGGITVLTGLDAIAGFAHLLTAMLTLALLTAGAVRGLGVRPSTSPGFRVATGLLLLNIFIIVVGGLIDWHDFGNACPHVPFCEGSTMTATVLHDMHRSAAGLLVFALIANAIWMSRHRGTALATGLNHAAALFAVGQIFVGVLAVVDTWPEGLTILHVGFATLIWWAILAQWLLAYRIRKT